MSTDHPITTDIRRSHVVHRLLPTCVSLRNPSVTYRPVAHLGPLRPQIHRLWTVLWVALAPAYRATRPTPSTDLPGTTHSPSPVRPGSGRRRHHGALAPPTIHIRGGAPADDAVDRLCTSPKALGRRICVHTPRQLVDMLSTSTSTPEIRASSGLQGVVHGVHTAEEDDESSLHPFPPPRMAAALPVDVRALTNHKVTLGSRTGPRPRNVRNPRVHARGSVSFP